MDLFSIDDPCDLTCALRGMFPQLDMGDWD